MSTTSRTWPSTSGGRRVDQPHTRRRPPYQLADAGAAEAEFSRRFPGFDPDGAFAALRRREYGRLDADGQVYLDYTGASLHAVSQIDAHAALLRAGVLGNPHSDSPTSLAATELVQRTRRRVCE